MDPNNPITYFGETDARNKKIKFGIRAKDRLKHMYVIGKTGMGKSTLLENMAIQDIQNGNGIAFIDPHGGTAEKLLEYVPEHRIKDVVVFSPFDMEYPIAFNIMEDVGPDRRHLVVNGLMSTFEKIWADAWSARMAYILQNTLLALLEFPNATLLAVNRMYTDKEFRKQVVDNIKDISVRSFWVDEYSKYTDKYAQEATPAIQNKVGQFASNPLIRNIIGQSKSSFDIRKIMDEKKILIINLSKGRVGEGNANLIGSMLITKIYLAAMSRADRSEAEMGKLPNFYLYVDEFQSFANKSFADILSEARKYKLNLTIAHQYIEQMEEEVRDAVFGNVGTMITFRVGAFDAEVLEKEFAPTFTAEDLVNLGFTQIYLKLMIEGVSSQPFSATTMAPIAKPDIIYKEQVIASSREQFARPRAVVEAEIQEFQNLMSGRAIGSSGQAPGNNPNLHPGGTPGAFGNPNNMRMNQEQRYQNNTPQYRPQPVPAFQPPMMNPERELSSGRPSFDNRPPQRREEPRNDIRKPELPRDVPRPEESHKSVFAQAAKELQQKQTAPIPQNPVVKLNDLKPAHEKAKIPTVENVNSLKDALSAVLKQAAATPPVPKVTNSITSTTTNNTVNVTVNTPSKPVTPPAPPVMEKKPEIKSEPISSPLREVPEDVLRKLLQVEEPRKQASA